MKWIKLTLPILAVWLMLTAAAPWQDPPTPTDEEPDVIVEPPAEADLTNILDRFPEAQLCDPASQFYCVTVTVPLDYANPEGETLDIVYAIRPADGERQGMFVQASPGGPGGEGLSVADVFIGRYDPAILESFDIVYFDQRGMGRSGELSCDEALSTFYEARLDAGGPGWDTPEEVNYWRNVVQTFRDDCLAEIGIPLEHYQFYRTEYVADDLELFRQTVGDETFYLYGVSYGSTVAQAYAAEHAEHLDGLILDGTSNPNNNGDEYLYAQRNGFAVVRQAVLEECTADPVCAADFITDPITAYDNLVARLSQGPIPINYPTPSGDIEVREFTLEDLNDADVSSMYSITLRMLFLRALASADNGNLVPLNSLRYQYDDINPETLDYEVDPTFSSLMYYGVNCADQVYFDGTPEERIAAVIDATLPRTDGLPRWSEFDATEGVLCALWPASPAEDIEPGLITAEGVPTLILNATLDPATPFEEGETVFNNLDDGYHIYVEGGPHAIYNRGEACPTDFVNNLLLTGERPPQRVTVCDWAVSVYSPYVPNAPQSAAAYPNAAVALNVFFVETFYTPAFLLSDLAAPFEAGCTVAGRTLYTPVQDGEVIRYNFDACTFSEGFSVTGTGSYDTVNGIIEMDVTVSGDSEGSLQFTRNLGLGTITVSGTLDGEPVDISL